MALREALEMTQISAIGCNNNKGFTLIEILVVIVVIGIASSLIFLNLNSVVSIAKNKSTFTKSFSYLSEESIVSGNIIGWHANNERQFFYFLDTSNNVVSEIKIPIPEIGKILITIKKLSNLLMGQNMILDFIMTISR